MSHIPNQLREIYKLGVGMYSAVAGVTYVDELYPALEVGMSVRDLYVALVSAESFRNYVPALANAADASAFVDALLAQLLGSYVTPAGRAFAFDFLLQPLQFGRITRADAIKIALDALDAAPHSDADFGRAAERFDNRIEAAKIYSEVFNESSADIGYLQALIAGVTDDPATMPRGALVLLASRVVLMPSQGAGTDFVDGPENTLFFTAVAVEQGAAHTPNIFDALDGNGRSDTLQAILNTGSRPDTYIGSPADLFIEISGTTNVTLANYLV